MDVFVASRQITSLVGSFRFSFLISLKAQKYKKKPGKKLIKNCPSFSTFQLERSTGQYQTDSTLHSVRFMRPKSKFCTPHPSSLYSLQLFFRNHFDLVSIFYDNRKTPGSLKSLLGFRVTTQKKICQVKSSKVCPYKFQNHESIYIIACNYLGRLALGFP